MRPLAIVETQIIGQRGPVAGQRIRNPGKAFFLDGAVEPFQMAVIGRGAHPGVLVRDPGEQTILGEVSGEFRSVVGLQGAYPEWEKIPRALQGAHAGARIGAQHRRSVREPGTKSNAVYRYKLLSAHCTASI